MKKNLKVLLVGRGFEQARTTLSRLTELGCRYQCASSLSEADRLVREQRFDLVLNGIYVESHNVCSLREALRGTPATLLYSYEVEDGFWWILGLDRGRPCVGEAPAVPSSDFSRALDVVLAALVSGSRGLPKLLTGFSCGEARLPRTATTEISAFEPEALHATAS
jgi:hypothetical protein